MSIAALIKTGEEHWDGIPVSTNDAFNALWKPGIAALGLQWIPLFESGLPVPLEDWKDIEEELVQLRAWAVRSLEGEDADYVIARIDRLLKEIPRALSIPNTEVYIG